MTLWPRLWAKGKKLNDTLSDKDIQTADETIRKYGEASQQFEVHKDGQVYEGREVAVKGEPLIDPGQGDRRYLRCFMFGKNPEYKGRKLSNQEIFNWHWRELSKWLWGDGLVPVEEIEPKVTHFPANRKYPLGGYVIAIVTKPRFGISAFDETKTLQEILPAKSLPKKK